MLGKGKQSAVSTHPISRNTHDLFVIPTNCDQGAGATSVASALAKTPSTLCRKATCSVTPNERGTISSTIPTTPSCRVLQSSAVLQHSYSGCSENLHVELRKQYQPEHIRHEEKEFGGSEVNKDNTNTSEQAQKTIHLLEKLLNEIKKIDNRLKAIEGRLDRGSSTVNKTKRKPVPPTVRVSTQYMSRFSTFSFLHLSIFSRLTNLDDKLLIVACMLSKLDTSWHFQRRQPG